MYEIIVYDKHSDITIENSFTDLQHRLATGQAVDSFYYDMEERKAEWWYCGKHYILTDIDYDVIKLAFTTRLITAIWQRLEYGMFKSNIIK